MAAQQPTALMEELTEEILVRVPPDDPARLMRSAVACKPWCRLVSGPGFRRRFREHHGSPPLLGIVKNCMSPAGSRLVRFVPTGSFCPRRAEVFNSAVVDSRHGRVLLRSSHSNVGFSVAVWDPIMDELQKLPATPWMPTDMWNYKGAVLCAGDGCDHLDCHGKPFLVVFVGVAAFCDHAMSAYVYSSEANTWSGPTRHKFLGHLSDQSRSTLVENGLYFVINKAPGILKYNLGTREVTAISRPTMMNHRIALMTAEDGGLGCATMTSSKLCLWSAEVGPDGNIGWALGKIIELSTLVPAGDSIFQFDISSSMNGGGIVHVVTKQEYRYFTTNLKSGHFCEVRGIGVIMENMVPFMDFYTPALQVPSTDEDPKAGEPPALSSEEIKNLAPEALSDEGLPRKKKLVEAIGQSKATQEDKDPKKKDNKQSNENNNEDK